MQFLEFPLVIFTVLAQCAVGAYLLVTWRLVGVSDESKTKDLAVKSLFFVLGFMTIGFMASTMHLGSPFRAFNSLNRVGASNLSNEILAGSAFFAIAGIYWLTELLGIASKGVRTLLRYLGGVLGLIFMVAMYNVYLIDTVPLWNTIYTPVEFIFTMLTAGLLLGYVLINLFENISVETNKKIGFIGVALIIIHLVVIIARILDFSTVQTSLHQACNVLSEYTSMILLQAVFMIIASMLWVASAHQTNGKMKFYGILALIVLVIAEIFSRSVFYGMHFTYGLL